MINVFYRNRHTIGQFMVVLILLGTFGFLFTYEFVSDSQASGCCGGGEVTSFAADSSGDFGSDIPTDASDTGGLDKSIPSSSNNNGSTPTCPTGANGCNHPSNCSECKTNPLCSGGGCCTSA